MNSTYILDDLLGEETDDLFDAGEFSELIEDDLDVDYSISDESFLDDEEFDFYEQEYFDSEDDPGTLVNPIELIKGFRKMLQEKFRHFSLEELDDSLNDVLDTMSPEEEFNFGKVLGEVGKGGKKFLQSKELGDIGRTVLPAAGSVVGTIYGGPAGTAIGGKLGQAAGQTLFKTPQGKKVMAQPSGQVQAPAQGGSAPAAQLLQLTQNPAVLNALGSMAMGSLGTNSVPIGNSGQSLSVGSIINMLGELTKQLSADADELFHESDNSYSYLQDSEGEFVVDPADPSARARALYSILMGA